MKNKKKTYRIDETEKKPNNGDESGEEGNEGRRYVIL